MIKTIGDSVMAVFPRPVAALKALCSRSGLAGLASRRLKTLAAEGRHPLRPLYCGDA